MTRILPIEFQYGEGPDEVRVTATVAATVIDETYQFTFRDLRVGEHAERVAAVSPRLFARLEDEAAWAYEMAEATARRNAKQIDDIVSAARAHAGVMT